MPFGCPRRDTKGPLTQRKCLWNSLFVTRLTSSPQFQLDPRSSRVCDCASLFHVRVNPLSRRLATLVQLCLVIIGLDLINIFTFHVKTQMHVTSYFFIIFWCLIVIFFPLVVYVMIQEGSRPSSVDLSQLVVSLNAPACGLHLLRLRSPTSVRALK